MAFKKSPRKPPVQSAAFTTEFRHEYEAEKERWLRRRFLWYSGALAVLNLLPPAILISIYAFDRIGRAPEQAAPAWWTDFRMLVLSNLIMGFGLVAAFLYVRRHLPSRAAVLRLAYAVIIGSGILQLLKPFLSQLLFGTESAPIGRDWMEQVLVAHVLACLFLPLTPRESYKPLIPLLLLNVVVMMIAGGSLIGALLAILLSPLVGVPGAAICWWRYSRFRDQFTLNQLRGRYAELRHELLSARQIHESLFPKPIMEGPVSFAYVYEPMRQIGGDYLYATTTPGANGGRILHVALIDVTGHGIPAALTVNRLHGELERIFAENPGAGPGEVLTLLNRYVHLTLATHSIYVTAVCLKVDPERQTLEYASGGHPPAFVRAVDGTIERLDSTALVLGAAAGADFEAAPREVRFGPGDVLIAYTDGASEARNAHGRYFGIEGIQAIIAGETVESADQWPRAIAAAVDRHRYGPSADDTLVIEITRTLVLERSTARGPRTGAAVGTLAGSASP